MHKCIFLLFILPDQVLGNSNYVPGNIHILRYSALQYWLLTTYEDYENLNAAEKNNYIHRSTRMSIEKPDSRGCPLLLGT